MNDESNPTPNPTEALADWLARREDATFSDVMNGGPSLLDFMQTHYPARLEALRVANASWTRNGRPANVRPIAPPATEREPVAAPPAPAPIVVPDPTTATMKDLLAAGPAAFAAFKERHPAEFDRLAAGLGMPVSRTRP